MICKHKLTELNGFKYCYVSLKIQLNIGQLFTHKDLKVLFQIIRFSLSDLFALSLNVKQFYLTYR